MRRLFLLVMMMVAGLGGPLRSAQAQGGTPATRHVAVRWAGLAPITGPTGARRLEPTFEGAFVAPPDNGQTLAVRLEGAVSQGELQNAVYEPFTAEEARLLRAANVPAAPVVRLAAPGLERKLPVTTLFVQPLRRNPATGQAEKLVAFDYAYSLEPATARRGGTSTRVYAPNSVLRSGDWFKLGVAESGIYKLDKAALRGLGLDANALNPNRLQLYGNGVGILPQPNAAPRPDDLVENNVHFVGNADNTFDDNEYFLFYSPGAHTWEASDGVFRHRNNIYTDTTYYFVTVGNTPGRRVAAVAPPAGSPAPTAISTFAERRVYERDLVNLVRSGRQWLGEGFNGGSGAQREVAFEGLADLVPNSPVRITASLAAGADAPSTFALTLNGVPLGTQAIGARVPRDYHAATLVSLVTHLATLPGSPAPTQRVGIGFANAGDPTAAGYLDYVILNAQRQLRLAGGALEFRSFANIGPGSVSRFALAAPAGAVVWDVTNPRRAQAQTLEPGGAFVARTDTLREYVALVPGPGYPVPRAFGRVPNQDLHALGLGSPVDLVIVTYPPFKGQAERLANHRRTRDGLRVAVVTTTEVYNEYASGGQDVTAIRDFMKQVYDRAPVGKEQYLLLFGDASFDYKSDPFNDKAQEPAWWSQRTPFRTDADFDRANQNYVPTYESRESFAQFYGNAPFFGVTYSSEDYYGLLDDNEGEWGEGTGVAELLDVGVGRLPVRCPKGSPRDAGMAQRIVDKLIAYDAPAAYGKWRNRITLAADDGDDNHYVVQDSEPIATALQRDHPEYNVHKTYLDMYPQISVAAGQRSPAANAAVEDAFEQGTLLWNYVGHGGPRGLADEQLFSNAMALNFRNPSTLPFMVTGTCDLSTYDDPDVVSAGELVLTDNPNNGGAVGLFTTTRVVNATENTALNQSFFQFVLLPQDGVMPRMGSVVVRAKNNGNVNLNSRNYTILGDPSMRLAYPEQDVVLDQVNGRPVSGLTLTDTLRALNRVTLHGQVRLNNALNANFNGRAQITLYDKPTTITTLGDQNTPPVPVQVQESVVYSGQATVTNGEFAATFVVPKDINYQIDFGKASLYAFDATRRVDGHGNQRIRVGGAGGRNAMAPETTPPDIVLFMDSDTGPTSFANGGLTGPSTTLLAHLSDASGINTTGAGVGHEITATFDRDRTKVLILNDAYVAALNDFTSGKARNLYKDLSPGPHVITLKAWDTFNNSAEKDIEFVVASTEALALSHVLNYPNPFASTTTFHFDHNRVGNDLDVQVQVFTVTGKLVKTLRTTVVGSEAHQSSLSWNGRDDYDDPLARGVYVYRVSVRLADGSSAAARFEKLVLLN